MNPIHLLFPSEPLGVSCGCATLENEPINCDEFEENELSKINSEIVESGAPYKEIEIIINDNRMVLRIQKLQTTIKEEWDPPCDCLPGSSPQQIDSKPQENPHQVITALPPPPEPTPQTFKPEKLKSPRAIDLAENPNIFLLKIRKRSEMGDRKRENIDLEFTIPRPLKPKPIEKKRKSFREEYQEQKENKIINEDNKPAINKKGKKGKKK